MASPSESRHTYDVFLSFRGLECRKIVSHIWEALRWAGIHTYIDSKKLEKGEPIAEALMDAIEDSRIALIVFSEDYASSVWCLKEVAKIMECRDTDGLSVLPVFYEVDPREVRGGRASYKEAFRKHRKKCEEGKAAGFNLKDVNKWEEALANAGGLSGWVYNKGVIKKSENGTLVESGSGEDKTEEEFVKCIRKEISILCTRIPCHVAKYPVGLVSQVDHLMSILRMRSRDEVQDGCLVIGIWAMGGIGKTTLAVALYNLIFENFDGSAFLGGISSDSKSLESLQKKLLLTLTKEDIIVTDRRHGINLIKKRLGRRRVLIVLDGVDDLCQIEALAGEHSWFGDGSRIIITARDRDVLSSATETIHEVKVLETREACELFGKYASGNGEKVKGGLVDRALKCTGGLPLALEKLGSAIHKNSEKDWNTEQMIYAISSDQTINGMLKKSYNALDSIHKEIFLHIACFFNGWSRKYVEGVLDSCNFSAANMVDNLIQRSLIRAENGILQVHPLIELMGKKIVDEEDHCNPAKRSRLWCHEDVVRVLSKNKGKNAVIGIVLAPTQPKEIKIGSNPFGKLKKLRFLIMLNVKTSFPGPIDLPDELRWFEWPECPAPSLKFTSAPLDLAVLAVRKNLLLRTGGATMI